MLLYVMAARSMLIQFSVQMVDNGSNLPASLLPPLPAALPTLLGRTRLAQSISAAGLHHHSETSWLTRNAPEPRELLWHNLGMTLPTRTTSSILMWVLFWLMTCFYMIPITAIQVRACALGVGVRRKEGRNVHRSESAGHA
jgi:hypothetical protein